MIAQDLYGFDILRPREQPSPNIPIGAHSAGHYRLTPPFVATIKKMPYVQLFWCVRGSGTIELQGVARTLKTGQIAIYFPGMLHKWHTEEQPWDFWWVAIDGPMAESVTMAFGLNADIYDAGPAPIKLFKRLEKTIRIPSKQCELESSSLAFEILTLASGRHQDNADPLARAVMERIHSCWNSPNLTVKTLAADFHIHRSILTRRFRQLAGISPVQYISHIRMQNILLFLQQTNLTIGEIAERCGHNNAGYIGRLIRQLTGVSPRQYRLLHKSR